MSTKDEKLAELAAMSGVKNSAILKAVVATPREQFLGSHQEKCAHADEALPIDCGQTISQPSLVARMTELMMGGCEKIHKALEIGTGSGYQAAILSHIVDEVYTIERIKPLLNQAQSRFKTLGLTNIKTLYGDGYLGWSEHAPYDGIIVTAAATEVPDALLAQLSEKGGRMIIPIGEQLMWQRLQLIVRHQDQYETILYNSVVFVPMLHGRKKR